uniref:Uncharacterized protein n=1 Tax=Molossus molossus TaxID=27622 RepID=A0A7J8BYK7_MOLMO|nr:hypothetical protein HJG59_010070 [Molossus molossus]
MHTGADRLFRMKVSRWPSGSVVCAEETVPLTCWTSRCAQEGLSAAQTQSDHSNPRVPGWATSSKQESGRKQDLVLHCPLPRGSSRTRLLDEHSSGTQTRRFVFPPFPGNEVPGAEPSISLLLEAPSQHQRLKAPAPAWPPGAQREGVCHRTSEGAPVQIAAGPAASPGRRRGTSEKQNKSTADSKRKQLLRTAGGERCGGRDSRGGRGPRGSVAGQMLVSAGTRSLSPAADFSWDVEFTAGDTGCGRHAQRTVWVQHILLHKTQALFMNGRRLVNRPGKPAFVTFYTGPAVGSNNRLKLFLIVVIVWV